MGRNVRCRSSIHWCDRSGAGLGLPPSEVVAYFFFRRLAAFTAFLAFDAAFRLFTMVSIFTIGFPFLTICVSPTQMQKGAIHFAG